MEEGRWEKGWEGERVGGLLPSVSPTSDFALHVLNGLIFVEKHMGKS